jgi:hypothetical protein
MNWCRSFGILLVLCGGCRRTGEPNGGDQIGGRRLGAGEKTGYVTCIKKDWNKRERYGGPTTKVEVSLDVSAFGPFPKARMPTWSPTPAGISTHCASVGTNEPTPPGIYMGGGFIQTYCSYDLGTGLLHSEEEVARALSPIDSPRKALALLAITERLAYQPEVGPSTVLLDVPTALAKAGPVHAFSFEKVDRGFIVRVPIGTNCDSGTYRVAYLVSETGQTCTTGEPSVIIRKGTGLCTD